MDIKEFLLENKQNIIDDLAEIIAVRSVKSQPQDNAPFGGAVREVQLKALALCEREGLKTTDNEGIISFADYGPMAKHIGVFSHLDVVPEGEGWDTPPYVCTERDGFLVGRGTGDNKGPFIMSLYALKYIKEHNIPLKYGIRLIMGGDEEAGMSDAEYYVEHLPQPVFTIVPDSDFPVCHGEKGIYQTDYLSQPITNGSILTIGGGLASNVVPDHVYAMIKPEFLGQLSDSVPEGITVNRTAEGVLVEASGVTAHAGTPFKGVNAFNILFSFLCDSGVLTEEEKAIALFIRSIAGNVYGTGVELACDDGRFTPLTIITGMITKDNNRIRINVNVRYPAAVTPDSLEEKMKKIADNNGFIQENTKHMPVFYLDPDKPEIRLLSTIYHELSGKDGTPYVMSGGTYARKLKNAVAFGPDFKDAVYPEWVGAAHMKNEGLNIEDMLLAIEIYANVLIKLQEVEF